MLKLVKWTWRLVLVGVLALSLSLNVAMFVGGMLYDAASSAVHAMTGMRTVAMRHADEVTELTGEVAQERAVKRKLRREMTDVADDLALERATTRKLRAELADTSPRWVRYRGRKVALKEAVNHTAKRISKRAAATSARELSSMAGEAIPYVGVAVVVGATAMELKSLCNTMKDMSELQRAFDPDTPASADERTVCARRVPSREEVWATVKSSPGKAWGKARSAVPTLEEIREYQLPNVDWEGKWSLAVSGAGKGWEATKSGSSSAIGAITEGISSTVDGVTSFWSDDSETPN